MGKRQGQRRKTCPIDGGATLSCHRHTDISTASATSGSYAARRFLDISSKNHGSRNALPHLTLTNLYPFFFYIWWQSSRVQRQVDIKKHMNTNKQHKMSIEPVSNKTTSREIWNNIECKSHWLLTFTEVEHVEQKTSQISTCTRNNCQLSITKARNI